MSTAQSRESEHRYIALELDMWFGIDLIVGYFSPQNTTTNNNDHGLHSDLLISLTFSFVAYFASIDNHPKSCRGINHQCNGKSSMQGSDAENTFYEISAIAHIVMRRSNR